MKKKNIIAISFVILFFAIANSQTTITLQPSASLGKDALLHGLLSESSNNFGSSAQLAADAWTFNGTPGVVRSVLNFDLSSIPNEVSINSATLSLYSWDTNSGFGQHSTLSGSNACWLQRVTSSWDESTVTWNNQPTTTSTNQVEITASASPTQDYLNIDVTNLVQDMIDNPTSSFGFMLKLQDENFYRLMNFASSDHSNNTLHPKLIVNYSQNLSISKTISSDIDFKLFPNPTSHYITLDLKNPNQKSISIEIINALGQIIERKSNNQSTTIIDVSKLSKGIYILKATFENHILKKQIIIE